MKLRKRFLVVKEALMFKKVDEIRDPFIMIFSMVKILIL